MSGGNGVVAGPEVDMAELDAISSAHLAVDLDLNLGPSFALELALGGHEFEESVPVLRPNWPRFEPGILAGGQEDEAPAVAEDPNLDLPRFGLGNIRDGHRNAVREALTRSRVMREDGDGSLRGLLQAFRNTRHIRHPRRPIQAVFTPIPDLVQTQDSSEHGSTTESRVAGAADSAVSIILPSELNPNTLLEIAPSQESNEQENGKKIEAGSVGVHFECNICLEMATEPVVTCCGHLFCWPCLYPWLHLHSRQKECPVCKGCLSDSAAITPIYGRGSAQDTEKANRSTPPRPHAHRINGKRRWQDRFGLERPDEWISADVPRTDGQMDRNEPEASNSSELVLNRLRVAQRLQREYIDERFRLRLRQRLMGRRVGSFRSPTTMVTTLENDNEQHQNESLLTGMTMNRLETADSLADGLRENLERMQRTLGIMSSLQAGIPGSGEGTNAGPSRGRSTEEERVAPPEIESTSPGHSTNVELHVETPELPQTSRRVWHRAVNSASGSFDAEPGSLHARKRRRLN